MDKYQGHAAIDTQPDRWKVLVPDDAVDFGEVPQGVYFNAAGNVALVGSDDNVVTLTVAAGDELDWRPKRINVTNTTVPAGNIIGVFNG